MYVRPRVCFNCGKQFKPRGNDRTVCCSRACGFEHQRYWGRSWQDSGKALANGCLTVLLKHMRWQRPAIHKNWCAGDSWQRGHATLDHITPMQMGGDNRKSNLVTACTTCNTAKGNALPLNYIHKKYGSPR